MMPPRAKAELIDGMYVTADEAYLPEEWERRMRPRTPEQKARTRAQVARWRAANPEKVKEHNREYMRRRRHGTGYVRYQIVASLHDLRCYGPTRETGCVCKKVRVLRPVG